MKKIELEVIQNIDKAFFSISKPHHFTDYNHCEECLEHDDTLRNTTREKITRKELGNAGWDPLCFSTAEGIAYYLPALARMCMLPETKESYWYGGQLAFHLSYDDEENRLFLYCNPEQKEAIVKLLRYILDAKQATLVNYAEVEEFENVYRLWSKNH